MLSIKHISNIDSGDRHLLEITKSITIDRYRQENFSIANKEEDEI